MTHSLIFSLFATLSRALLAHACGQLLQWILMPFLPGVSPFASVVVCLTLSVIFIEIAARAWNGGSHAGR